MTIQNALQNIIKTTANELEKFQLILEKSGYSLDEIIEFDDGQLYQKWSAVDGHQLTLDILPTQPNQSEQIISEIIDCWLELRAIRNTLETETDSKIPQLEKETSASQELIENIHSWEKEMQEDSAMYKLMIKGEIDTALLAYYTLDEKTKQAVLQ